MKSVGLLGSPYMPPIARSSTARSIMVSADSPKQRSFQYTDAWILFRVIFSTRF